MRLRLTGALLRRALLRPEPIIALLVLAAAVFYFVSGLAGDREPHVRVNILQQEPETVPEAEVRLILFDSAGLETPTFVTIPLPEEPAPRTASLLSALRSEALADPWPEALPVPQVYVETVDRQQIAVLDFRPSEPLNLTVEAEARLLRSIEETLLENGVDDVRYLLDGEAAGVFLEHLAVPSAL